MKQQQQRGSALAAVPIEHAGVIDLDTAISDHAAPFVVGPACEARSTRLDDRDSRHAANVQCVQPDLGFVGVRSAGGGVFH